MKTKHQQNNSLHVRQLLCTGKCFHELSKYEIILFSQRLYAEASLFSSFSRQRTYWTKIWSTYDFKCRHSGSRAVRVHGSAIYPSNINSISSSILTYTIFFQTANLLPFAYSMWLSSLCVILLPFHYEHHLHVFKSFSSSLSHRTLSMLGITQLLAF